MTATFDPSTGALHAPVEELWALLEGGTLSPALVCGTAASDRGPGPLHAVLEAVRHPASRLLIHRGGQTVSGWVDDETAALLVPSGDGSAVLSSLPAAAVPGALATLLALGPRPRASGSACVPAAALAVTLAAPPRAPAALREAVGVILRPRSRPRSSRQGLTGASRASGRRRCRRLAPSGLATRFASPAGWTSSTPTAWGCGSSSPTAATCGSSRAGPRKPGAVWRPCSRARELRPAR